MRTPESDCRIVNKLRRIGPFSVGTCKSLTSLARSKNYSPLESSEFLEEYRQVSKANVDELGFEDYPDWSDLSIHDQMQIRRKKLIEFLIYLSNKNYRLTAPSSVEEQ